ncbi:S-layer homology domain-containing protein [uncultured Intestinimonas sp.]|uniref:S-layer homology domain-containing protein n=1 Tax=uncultured Intestinimonas sp. TaxID=1689265 RepID=UPI0029424DCA|nr:S-layer homology domain-containing protein [uncultured Intestinimonas sp.]
MRNLKRALSLALASVMVMSMMVIGAGAASYDDFSDKDKIVNKEAVQMLVELGVINGKDTGDFDPTGIVTRAEMAKMICVVLNGGKDPSLGSTVTNSYTDTVGHWAAGYIEYCTQLGIVAGDGAGKFNPNTTVTGSEAAKMLLVALGYKSEVEGFIGANWAIGVNVRANQKGLYSDLTISVDEGLTRDSAAQMIYNALDAGVVHYDYTLVSDGSTISSSPTLIDENKKTLLEDKFNAVKVEGVVVANEVANLAATSAKGSSLDEGKTSIAITNDDDQSAYAGTKTFSVSTGMDELGRAVVVYVKKDSNSTKAEVLGAAITSADNKVVVDNSKDAIADVADDNDLTIAANTKMAFNYGGMVSYNKDLDPKTAGIEKILVDTDADGDVDYVLMNTYAFGKVTTYTTSGDGNITISTKDDDGKTSALSADDKDDVVGFDDVAKNDYVLAAYIGGDLHVAKAETVVGMLEAYKGSNPATKLTVAGTDYNVSNIKNIYTGGDDDIDAANTYGANSLDTEATFYLDKNGYVVAVGNVSENAYNYALVMAKGTSVDERVKVALADGTTGTYDLNTSGLKLSEITVGGVYAYTINSDKKIKLTNDTDTDGDTTEDATFTKGKTSIGKVGASDKTYYANGNTVFFYTAGVKSGTISDVDVYNGYAKAPTLDDGKAAATVYLKNDRVMAVVFTGDDLTTANVDDNLYISSVGTSTSDYTNATAFIAGSTEATSIKVDGSVAKGVYTYTVNSDGYYELMSVPAGNSIADATVYLSNSNTVVFEKDSTKTELKITSKTLLVNNSEYLSDPVAELGAGPDEGDKIAYVVYNKDNSNADEALLIVVKNAEQKDDDGDIAPADYTKVNVSSDTLTIDHRQATLTPAEIKSVLKTWAKADSVKYNANDKTVEFVGGPYDGDVYKVALNKVVAITLNGTLTYVDDGIKLDDSALNLDGTYAKVTDADKAESYKKIDGNTAVADGFKYEGGYYKVTYAATSLSAFSNTTEAWTIGSDSFTKDAYVKDGTKVTVTITVDSTGFTAATSSKLEASNPGEVKWTVNGFKDASTAPNVDTAGTVSFTNTESYKDGSVSFTWTVDGDDLAPTVTATNA